MYLPCCAADMRIMPAEPIYKTIERKRKMHHLEHTVEVQRSGRGGLDEETAAFYTREEAEEWARTMLANYGWRKAWINGIEYVLNS